MYIFHWRARATNAQCKRAWKWKEIQPKIPQPEREDKKQQQPVVVVAALKKKAQATANTESLIMINYHFVFILYFSIWIIYAHTQNIHWVCTHLYENAHYFHLLNFWCVRTHPLRTIEACVYEVKKFSLILLCTFWLLSMNNRTFLCTIKRDSSTLYLISV